MNFSCRTRDHRLRQRSDRISAPALVEEVDVLVRERRSYQLSIAFL